jgi:uncharacterized protein YecT (DUF1311 family)
MRTYRHEHFGCCLFHGLRKFVVTTVFCGSLLAAGHPDHAPAPCQSQTTTAAMQNCETFRYQQAEPALDSAYKELMAKSDPAGKVKLRAAESAWLLFRKDEADFQVNAARGVTLAPLIRIAVVSDLTENGVAELKKSLRP